MLKVFRKKLEIGEGTDSKIYYLDGKRIAKSKLLEAVVGTYDLGENFKDINERKFEISLSALENAKKNKEQRDLLKELVKKGQVVKRSGLKNS